MMQSQVFVAVAGGAVAMFGVAGSASAGLLGGVSEPASSPVFIGDDPDGLFSKVSPTMLETRFKAATTNWDTRLEEDGSPSPGDLVGHVANGTSSFEGKEFGFSFSYDNAADEVSWSVERFSNGAVTTLVRGASGASGANAIEFFSVGSRGIVDVRDLTYADSTGSVLWPELDSTPFGPTFSNDVLFFGDGGGLMDRSWSLSGSVFFDGFTKSNPDEGVKIAAKLYRGELVPAPGAGALLGVAGVAAVRRRRRG